MQNGEWRPKVGERVAIYGTVAEEHAEIAPLRVRVDGAAQDWGWYALDEVHPFPAPAAPRAPWEVLREAADVVCADGDVRLSVDLKHIADRLEAAAAPKVPTLAEAVRAYLDKPGFWKHVDELREALARAEAGQ